MAASVSGSVWVFDLDGCLIDSQTGTSVRPIAVELLRHLRRSGRRVVLWSAGGAEYARGRVVELEIDGLFDAFFDKEGRDSAGRYLVEQLVHSLSDMVLVDDRPEDMPHGADVIAVTPYIAANPHDRGLLDAAERAGLVWQCNKE
jgi:FMN phosphatase YigB (HAD superfamily)